ncbi:glycosyltransferase family 2 protein [Oceanidesulfovibrio marinus]|uniref:Glycosyltransferase family 2 protein n=2 Tax=Oceanidesulfovibrio marinus TaxID=370038 RepID=A0A6P1ZG12_9BACT|nr:glycosyltransferase family 2 protein [Oceanidesulfovibrio marinus]
MAGHRVYRELPHIGRTCMQRAVIVLPTYNEAENVAVLLPRIFARQEEIPSHELHVLVVDDSSPDGTADVVRAMMADNPNIHLISGRKKGLGEAYKRGFRHALDTLDPDLILEMDADLQHDPAMLPVFIDLARHGFSLVIGSRFALGGSTPNFSLRRRAISLLGNWMLRFMGGLPPIRDCTSGFRCIKADLIRKCDLSFLSTKGYSFQSSLLFELIRNQARVIEVPIVFPDRISGKSKLSFADQSEFLLNIFKIRFRKSEEFLTFSAVGASGVVVNLGIYTLLTRSVGAPLEIASPVAIELSIIWNFLLNNVLTFRKRASEASFRTRFIRFHVVAGIAGVVNYAILLLLARGLGLWDIGSNLVGIGFGVLVNYFLNSRWTWRESCIPSCGDRAGQLPPQSS